jgi:hypothetical protein
MQDKQNLIINFNDAVKVYNNWATTTNSYTPLTLEDLKYYITKESDIYAY